MYFKMDYILISLNKILILPLGGGSRLQNGGVYLSVKKELGKSIYVNGNHKL